MRQLFIIFLCVGLLTSCATKRPTNVENICHVFTQYPKWYWATQTSARRWGVPISVQMAIVYQESRFSAKAKPPRRKLLWVIPWTRPSSAYGYTQALKMTWKNYKKNRGRWHADRDNFADAVDFIGWYGATANRKAGIPKHDAYRLYLAYHEGIGGYKRQTYLRKAWLINVAHHVDSRASIYNAQLRQCQHRLKSKPWYRRIMS